MSKELGTRGNLIFYVSHSHPDYQLFKHMSWEARRLWNTLNKVECEIWEHRRNGDPTPVCNKIGIKYSWTLEEKRKQIMSSMSILLPTKVAQNVRDSVNNTWKSVIALRKKGMKASNPSPKKDRYGVVPFNRQTLAKSDSWIIPCPTLGFEGFELPENIQQSQVQAMELVPKPNGFELHVLYWKSTQPASVAKPVFAAIDFGVDSLATIITTDGARPKRVDGREMKSFNRYINREVGKLTPLRQEAKNNGSWDEYDGYKKQIRELWYKRERFMEHELNTASNAAVRYLQEHCVSTLVLGWSPGFKRGMAMGRKNNQNFAYLPLARFRDLLKRKAEEIGIEVIIQEESYTSKASFIDGDPIPVYGQKGASQTVFSGRRISRGVYKSRNGTLIHADVNGAWNILRKSMPSIGWSSGVVVTPERLAYVK